MVVNDTTAIPSSPMVLPCCISVGHTRTGSLTPLHSTRVRDRFPEEWNNRPHILPCTLTPRTLHLLPGDHSSPYRLLSIRRGVMVPVSTPRTSEVSSQDIKGKDRSGFPGRDHDSRSLFTSLEESSGTTIPNQ